MGLPLLSVSAALVVIWMNPNLTYTINIIAKDNTSLSNKYTIYKGEIKASMSEVNIQNVHELYLPLCRNMYLKKAKYILTNCHHQKFQGGGIPHSTGKTL